MDARGPEIRKSGFRDLTEHKQSLNFWPSHPPAELQGALLDMRVIGS